MDETTAPRRTIGVRRLKNEATQIVRQVREQRMEFVITVAGEPVAILQPIGETADSWKARRERVRAQMASGSELATRVGERWTSPLSAIEAVREQRREL